MDYSLESAFVKQLDRDIMEFVLEKRENTSDERFQDLALREFELQYHTVKPYQEYCDRKGMTPDTVDQWHQIPAVPSMAFKKFVIASFPVERAEHAYFTSGTTDPKRKGTILRDQGAVQLINAANGLLTRKYVFPDVERMKILLMTPSPQMAPGMGMAIGLEQVRRQFGTPDSTYLISRRGLNVELLLKSLIESENNGEPLALVGSSSGFIYFFNACERDGIRFRLPPGSRVCDGGGYLGQFGECSRDEYHEKCKRVLGVEEPYCVNVLGMGEISTNFFDSVLSDYLDGRKRERHKVIAPWTRTDVVDINTFERIPQGETGLLRHYDIINRSMVLAVQTDNLGFMTEDGFEIVGRWKKKPGKLEAEEIKEAHGGKIMTQLVRFLLKNKMKRLGDMYKKITRGVTKRKI
jgi:hypothetical protein